MKRSSLHTLLIGSAMALAVAACQPAVNEPAAQPAAAAATAVTITDLRDRTVTLPAPGAKISIDDGRYLVALALIHPDPVSVLAAWSGDANRLGTETHAAYVAKFPALKDLPVTPSSAAEFLVEPVLAAAPGAAVVSTGAGPSEAQIAQLEGAGIPVVYIDFFTHPFQNQARSLEILGQLTGRTEQAKAYNAFRQAKLDLIASRVKDIPEDKRPTVFMEAHAGNGPDCCNSPGKGNMGDYITFVGGHNIGADAMDTAFGKLNLEYVIDRDPNIYIATGGPHLEKAGGFVVGEKYDVATSAASLRKVASRRGISTLKAVREGRTHGLSHQLINSPIDIVATEVLAKWIHPELFADLDPQATLNEINTKYLAVPYPGTYWVDLPKN